MKPVPQEYGTKLLANMAAGTGPDVYQVGDGDVAKFVDQGIVEPLDPYIIGRNGFDLNTTFFPAVAAFGQIGGADLPADQRLQPVGVVLQQRHVR